MNNESTAIHPNRRDPLTGNAANVVDSTPIYFTGSLMKPDLPTLLMHDGANANISRALSEALRDDRAQAVKQLQRAEGFRAQAPPDSPRAVNARPSLTAWQKRRVLEHIEANLAAPLRNKDLAELAEYSEFHFNVAFRNSLGASPHEFLIRRRIDRARQLMLSTDMPLCEVAFECGLADQAHMSRLFRRYVGASPAAWRRAQATS
jgi:AraC family transcriptional regulator